MSPAPLSNGELADQVGNGLGQTSSEPADKNAASNDPALRRMSIRESIDSARDEYAKSVKDELVTDKDVKPDLDKQTDLAPKLKTEDSGSQSAPASEKPTSLAAPSSWSKDARAKWDGLPPEIQQEVHRREEASSKGVAELKARYDILDGTISRHGDVIKLYNRPAAETVDAMFQWHKALTGPDKERQFVAFAKTIGIDLAKLAPAAANPAGAADVKADPNLNAALQPITSQLDKLTSSFDAQEQRRHLEERAKGEQLVKDWAADKPYYERVRPKMAQLIENDRMAIMAGQHPINGFFDAAGNIDLDGAYKLACGIDPDVRREVGEKEQAEQKAKLEADVKAAADKAAAEAAAKRKELDKAKRASSSLSPNTPMAAPKAADPRVGTKGESARNSIRRALAEVRENS